MRKERGQIALFAHSDNSIQKFVISNSGNKKSSKKQFPNDMIFSAIASMFPENGVPDDMKER
jgi:hypothetical protein